MSLGQKLMRLESAKENGEHIFGHAHQTAAQEEKAKLAEDALLKLESVARAMVTLGQIREASKMNLSQDERRLAQYTLGKLPEFLQPTGLRMESSNPTLGDLEMRMEGIGDMIAKFFAWIKNFFKRLFGGGDDADGAGSGSAASSATETAATASSNGVKEYRFLVSDAPSKTFMEIFDLKDFQTAFQWLESIRYTSKAIQGANEKLVAFMKNEVGQSYSGSPKEAFMAKAREVFKGSTHAYAKEIAKEGLKDREDGSFVAWAFTPVHVGVLMLEKESASSERKGFAKTPHVQDDFYVPVATWVKFTEELKRTYSEFNDISKKIQKDFGSDLESYFSKLGEEQAKAKASGSDEEKARASMRLEMLPAFISVVRTTLQMVLSQTTALEAFNKDARAFDEVKLADQAKAGREKEAKDAEDKKKAEEEKAKASQPAQGQQSSGASMAESLAAAGK